MKNLYPKGLMFLALLGSSVMTAQNGQRLKDIASNYSLDRNKNIHYIQLKDDYTVYENNTEGFLNSAVLGEGLKAQKFKTEVDRLGYTHTRYKITYNNVPLHNSQIIVHSANGKVVSVNGDFATLKTPDNQVTITEGKALVNAMQNIGATKYKWENKEEEAHMRVILNKPDFTFYPKGELVLFTKGEKVLYAYKFNIYAEQPLSRNNVLVDAQSGVVLEKENLICTADVPATATTKYSGVKSFTVDNVSAGLYRLRETGRGGGIQTLNLKNGTNYGAAVDFTNTSTSWTTTGVDQAATDAHWGAEMTWDYYMLKHGRNSVDGAGYQLLSYVHYSTGYNNAFWDGTRMTYGDGSGSYTIFTGLDVCGHEITHGVTENSSNLTYSNESGALNESYSDIFGNSIENYARPTQWSWKIGEDITGGAGLRNMSNPNANSNPDTYGGTYWYTGTGDNGGVHTNSGVSNYWYYLLVTGGTGTNDISNSYTVTGLGWTAASQIAFRANTVYYTPSTNYATARNLSIQAAIDLFGICSNEVKQTTNAWYAVGVGPAYATSVASNFNAASTSFCTLPATVNFNNTTAGGISYQWNFGDGSSVSTSTNPVHTYTANGTYSVKLKSNGCFSTQDSITKVAYITISTPSTPTTTGASRCGTGTLNLSATGSSQLYWYANPSATGTPVYVGNSYTTPSLTTTTSYYVVNTSTNTPVFGAPTNTSIGTGANYNTATAYEIFDVLQPCSLKTVVMYASTAGNRTIELRNSSNAVISSTVVALTIGANTVNVNFALPVGTGLRLGLNSASAVNLYRNSAGAVYPYNIGGLVSITGSSAGTPGYFYFFYNWQVQKNPCVSAPVAVTATVGSGPSLTVNTPTICNGQTANLTAGGATTYSWSSGQTTSSIAVTPSITTTYTVYGTSSSCTNSLTTSVMVNPNPTVSVNSATICSGQSINLAATGATTYSWSTGASSSNINVNPTATTSYTVTGYNGSCTNVKVSTVNVNPTPTVTVNSATICAGQSANLLASGATTYSWSTGATSAGISVTPSVSSSYSVTGTSGSCSNMKVANITVNPNPTVAVTSATICSGNSTNLVATGASTYSWSTGGTGSSISVSPTSNTAYTVTGYNGSCSDSKVTNVTVNTTPTVTVNSSTICTGGSATLTASGAGSYTFNPGNITGSAIAVSPTVTTTYTVTGLNGNCSGTAISNVVVNLCTGVQEIPATVADQLNVFPNPATDHLVVINTVASGMITINIYDIAGKLVKSNETDFTRSKIDISHLSNGMYMVEIMNAEKRIYRTKIVKE